VTSNVIGRQPSGSCTNRRTTVSRGDPSLPHRRHQRSGSATRHARILPVRLEPLPGDFKTELVEPAECGQVRASGGSVRQVEVFRMAGVGTSILGKPRPLPDVRRAADLYTLNCEEPVCAGEVSDDAASGVGVWVPSGGVVDVELSPRRASASIAISSQANEISALTDGIWAGIPPCDTPLSAEQAGILGRYAATDTAIVVLGRW
jgi:hypothetical protein